MIELKQGTKIIAKYAPLPVVDLSVNFLVEILEPLPQVPSIKRITMLTFVGTKKTHEECLKESLLAEWRNILNTELTGSIPQWMFDVDTVELIQCDLLTPIDPLLKHLI